MNPIKSSLNSSLRHYLVVTGGYWAFTLTDGAIRMLVVLYFHLLGYSPLQVAMLFLFYEFFGIVTNLVGGWLAASIGLNRTMNIGMAMQVVALLALTVPDSWLSVGYVMAAQALSGIAKDLNKMSAKASVKSLTQPGEGSPSSEALLFKWVAILTGSKNTLKGLGFFIGAGLLQWLGFRGGLAVLAGMLLIALLVTLWMLPSGVGKMKSKPKFSQFFSTSRAVNVLSAARFFLFGSRDIWFVVGLPVFLYETLGWDFYKVGGYLALWVVGYGIVQAVSPRLFRKHHPTGISARISAMSLAVFPAAIALALQQKLPAEEVVITGLILFGIAFAINSAIHSYLILAYSNHDKVAMNVGFYYMSNAGGRLAGTILSGWVYQHYGLEGCLWWSFTFVLMAGLISFALPDQH